MELIPEICVKCPGLSICGGGCRTGCMWDNNGSVSGTTMYIGEALTQQQADIFKKRVSHPLDTKGYHTQFTDNYFIKKDIKIRQESFGTIVFNPKIQSFAIVDKYIENGKSFKITDAKTFSILKAIGAIDNCIPHDDPPRMEEVKSIAGNILFPRLGNDLNAVDTYYCLRADTGEKYYF